MNNNVSYRGTWRLAEDFPKDSGYYLATFYDAYMGVDRDFFFFDADVGMWSESGQSLIYWTDIPLPSHNDA